MKWALSCHTQTTHKGVNWDQISVWLPPQCTWGKYSLHLSQILNLDSTPDIKVSGSFKEYNELLNKRLKYLHNLLKL